MSWLQLPIPGGIFRLQVSVSMIQVTSQYDGPLPHSAVFIIKNISIVPGSDCSDIAISKLDVTHIQMYVITKSGKYATYRDDIGMQNLKIVHR